MNTNKLLQTIRSGWPPLAVIAVTTLAVTVISVYCLASGCFIIFQNLFYIPIIIACVYYTRRGFAFSIVIACLYFLLTLAFTRESTILLQAFVRVLIFVLIAGVITYIVLARKRAEEVLRRQHDNLDGLVQERTAQLEADITERKKTEQAEETLRESEEKYKFLIDKMQEMAIILDKTGTILFANRSSLETFGYSKEEVIGKSMAGFLTKSSLVKALWALAQEFLGKHHGEFEVEAKNKKGEIRILQIAGSSNPIHKDGKMVGILISASDITERKRAEEILEQKNKNTANINAYSLEIASLPYGQVNAFIVNKLKEYVNAMAVLLTTYDAETSDLVITDSTLDTEQHSKIVKLMGKKMTGLRTHVSPEMYTEITGNIIGRRQSINEVTFGAIPEFVGNAIQKLFGITSFTGIALMKGNQFIGTLMIAEKSDTNLRDNEFFATFTGITANAIERRQAVEKLRENELKYRTLFETGDVANLLFTDGRWVDCNAGALKVFGCTREQIIGAHPSRFSPPTQPDGRSSEEEAVKKINRAYESEPQFFEWEHCRADGTSFAAEVSLNQLDLEGKPHMQAIVRDISDRKRAEESLRKNEERYRSLLTNLHAGVVVHAPDTSIIINNPRASELLGLSEDQMKGKLAIDPAWKFITENSAPLRLEDYPVNRIVASNKPIKNLIVGVCRPNTKDIVWLTVNGFPVWDTHGKLLEVLVSFIDITERKQAEEALRQSEEKFSKAFQTSSYAITITHAEDGRFVEVNDAFTSIAGYTREEALADSSIGMKLWVNEAERQRVVDDLRAGKAVNGHEYRFRTKSGKEITGLFSAQIIKLGSGPCILSSINDITERKRADADLRIKNQVFEDSVASQSIADKNGVITHVNPAFLRLWGYAAKEQAIGNSVGSFFADPDDAKPVLEALAAHDAWEGEFLARRVDGTTFISRGLATSLRDAQGELVGYQSTNLDITNEREAEETLNKSEARYRNLVENASVGIFRTMIDGSRVLDANPKLCEILGLTREEFVGQSSAIAWAHPEQRAELVRLLREKGNVSNYEIDIRTKAGEIRTVLMSMTTYPELGYLEGGLQDITERKLAEEKILQLNEQLQQKASELEQVVFIASHDLRSPLVNVQGFSKELGYSIKEVENLYKTEGIPDANKNKLQEILTKDIPETLHYIQSSIAKMDSLLSGLLKISRIGRVELTLENLDMNGFIKEIAGTFEYQFANKGISFSFSDLPVCRGDRVQISQVFSNIIDNAIKYGDPKRPGKINISGKSDKNHAVFCVEDNGIGIAREHIGKIFEIFHRLNPADASGEGLGLTIVQRILLKHKGKVWVESEVGEGSRFFVSLPSGELGVGSAE